MTRLSEETINGLLLEWKLAGDPNVTAKREAYYARIRAFAEKTKDKTKPEMIAELKADCPAYIVELLESHSEASVRDRYVRTFFKRGKP